MSQSDKVWGPQRTQHMGDGDGATTAFYSGILGPIMPGSVIVRVVNEDAVSRMAVVSSPLACEMAGHDITEDGILYGKLDTGTVDYMTGAVHVTWNFAPAIGSVVEVIWRRERHVLHGCKVQVKDTKGVKHWISALEFEQITRLAEHPDL